MKVEVTVRGIGQNNKDKIRIASTPKGMSNVYLYVDDKRIEINAGAMIEAIRRCMGTVGVAYAPFD